MSTTVTLLNLAPRDLATGRPYAERDEHAPPWHDKLAGALWHGLVVPLTAPLRSARAPETRRFVALVDAHAAEFAALDDNALRAQAKLLRVELRRLGFVAAPVARCFALVREAATRVLGKRH